MIGAPSMSSRPTEASSRLRSRWSSLISRRLSALKFLVDLTDGKPVMLETGPDEQMGIFGRLAPDGSSDYVPVMRFEPTATTAAIKQLPSRLIEPAPVSLASAVRRGQFVLNSGLCTSRPEAGTHAGMASLIGINGRPFDIDRIDIETKLGTTEIWEIISVGMAHPFHVHGALFRVLSIEGKPPPAHLAGWKDTLLVQDKAELARRLRSAGDSAPPLHVSLPHPGARGGWAYGQYYTKVC